MPKMSYRIALDDNSSKSFFCFFVNFAFFKRSGLLSKVLIRDWLSLHSFILLWSPDMRTSGTSLELKVSGLVNTGPFKSPWLNESSSTDFLLPITPGINLDNVSIRVSAANSPPLKT